MEVYLNAQRGSGRRIAIHNTPLLVNQELGKVPLDAVTKQATLARLQELVEGCGIATVDVNLIRAGLSTTPQEIIFYMDRGHH